MRTQSANRENVQCEENMKQPKKSVSVEDTDTLTKTKEGINSKYSGG